MASFKSLLVIDDSRRDLKIIHWVLRCRDKPFLRNVKMTRKLRPLDYVEDYGKFDTIILDQQLSGVTGTEIAAEIRKRYPRKPLMLLSGIARDLAHDQKQLFDVVADKSDLDAIWEGARELMRRASKD